MNIGLRLCFDKNFKKAGFYKMVYQQFVKFTPHGIMNEKGDFKWNEKKHGKLLENYNSNEVYSVSDRAGSIFFTMLAGFAQPYRSLLIIQSNEVFFPTENEIEEITDFEDFTAAYLYNEDFECIQTTKFESNNQQRTFSPEILKSIRNTPYKIGLHGTKEYETRFNPARSVLLNHVMLMVAWKMWFGEGFFKLVSKEKILSFPYAHIIKKLSNGNVFVQLYEKVEEPYTPDNIFRQWKWREWLDYDQLEETYT